VDRAWWRAILDRRMILCALTGFSSGLPLYVVLQLVPAWFRDQGLELSTIALFSLVGLPWTWKFLWAPLLDRYAPPLGRRRGWALLAQLGLLAVLLALGAFDPTTSVPVLAGLLLVLALFSATQDVALDAWRREVLADSELGLGNAFFVNAYRLASLVPGSLALILADQLPWWAVHATVAAFMGVGLLATALMSEPPATESRPRSLREAVVEPFRAFLRARGPGPAALLLAFIVAYKLGDSMATALATPFYLDLGFTKTDIGAVAKVASLWASVVGAFLGGLLMLRIGIARSLWLFGVVQLLSILGFAVLARVGPDRWVLFGVVSFEYLGVGLGTAALVAFVAAITDRRYTATQLALLTSLAGVPRTLANATTGWLVEALGYERFFVLCAALALPGMVLLLWVAPWRGAPVGPDQAPSAGS
jgi:MFS transporter, PAT family, beta-lactamase induction signal transducer AmpG